MFANNSNNNKSHKFKNTLTAQVRTYNECILLPNKVGIVELFSESICNIRIHNYVQGLVLATCMRSTEAAACMQFSLNYLTCLVRISYTLLLIHSLPCGV